MTSKTDELILNIAGRLFHAVTTWVDNDPCPVVGTAQNCSLVISTPVFSNGNIPVVLTRYISGTRIEQEFRINPPEQLSGGVLDDAFRMNKCDDIYVLLTKLMNVVGSHREEELRISVNQHAGVRTVTFSGEIRLNTNYFRDPVTYYCKYDPDTMSMCEMSSAVFHEEALKIYSSWTRHKPDICELRQRMLLILRDKIKVTQTIRKVRGCLLEFQNSYSLVEILLSVIDDLERYNEQ